MSNTRLQQLFAQKEALPGNVVAAGTLVAIGNAKNRVKDPKMLPTVETYQREILYGSISALTPLIGKVEMSVSFAVELAGSTNGNVVPVWAQFLESCGFRQATMTASTWSGTMTGTATGVAKVAKHGDIWQTAGAAKTIRILHDTYEGQANVFFEAVVGTPANADVFFPSFSDGTIGPIITLTVVTAAAGFAWYPNSRPIGTVTCTSPTGTNNAGDYYKGNTSGAVVQAIAAVTATTGVQFYLVDGTPTSTGETYTNLIQTGGFTTTTGTWVTLEMPAHSFALAQDGRIITTKGARGSMKLTCERGKPMFLEFDYKGAFSSAANGGSLAGVVFESKVPPRFQGIGFQLGSYVLTEPGDVAAFSYSTWHTPRIVSCNFDMGTGPNTQEDATQATGITGFASLTGTRNAQFGMKIDTRPEGVFPMIKKFTNGEPFAIKARLIDSTNAANNAFLLSSPGVKQSANAPTNTNNFQQDDISGYMSCINPDGSEGDQRELVLSYHYSSATAW